MEPPSRVNPWSLGWEHRLRDIADVLRETSSYRDDPQESVQAFVKHIRRIIPSDRAVSLSRRGLERPAYRITRSTTWAHSPDPWKEAHKLPMFTRGILGEFLYAGEPRFIPELVIPPDDPAREYLEGMTTAMVLPTWEEGEVLNMVVQMAESPGTFDPERLPEMLWTSNLFGRATKNLVLTRDVREAYAALDRELRSVAEMQMSLLPRETPPIRGLDVATHYQTSTRAGGDYYDFFDLGMDRWGILVADVSGHGTPAAVLMALVHAIAHLMPGEPWPPHRALAFVNRELTRLYTREGGAFVTMMYGVYDARERVLHYANAGHPEPMIRRRDGAVVSGEHPARGLPLGIMDEAEYATHAIAFSPGDALVLYTDGITEAYDASRELFGEERLKRAVARGAESGGEGAGAILASIIEAVGAHAGLTHRSDDRTLVVGLVKE